MTSQPSHTLVIHDFKHKHIYESTLHVTIYESTFQNSGAGYKSDYMLFVFGGSGQAYAFHLHSLRFTCIEVVDMRSFLFVEMVYLLKL